MKPPVRGHVASHLIGGNVKKAFYLSMPRDVEHHLGAQNVRADKFLGAQNTSVYMRFGREVHHGVAVFGKRFGNRLTYAAEAYTALVQIRMDPEQLARATASHTGRYLQRALSPE